MTASGVFHICRISVELKDFLANLIPAHGNLPPSPARQVHGIAQQAVAHPQEQLSVLLIRSDTEEGLEKKKELWKYLKSKDRKLFLRMRNGLLGYAMNLPGRGGRKISVGGYKICQKIFKFN